MVGMSFVAKPLTLLRDMPRPMTQIFALNLARLNIGRFFRLGFILWLFAELLVFLAVGSVIGIGHAMLLGLASTTLGIVLLFRFGREAALDLRNLMNGRLAARRTSAFDKSLTAAAIALLILPGFLSDLAGLALLLPPIRIWLAAKFAPKDSIHKSAFSTQTQQNDESFEPRQHAPQSGPRSGNVIDLPEGEWRRVDDQRSY